jgi:hypothetical protein
MSSVKLIIVPMPSRRAVPSVAQVSSLNVGRSRRVPRNRKGQSRRAVCLLRGTERRYGAGGEEWQHRRRI